MPPFVLEAAATAAAVATTDEELATVDDATPPLLFFFLLCAFVKVGYAGNLDDPSLIAICGTNSGVDPNGLNPPSMAAAFMAIRTPG